MDELIEPIAAASPSAKEAHRRRCRRRCRSLRPKRARISRDRQLTGADVFAPEVLADPIGVVVDLIAERQPGLDRDDHARRRGDGRRSGQTPPTGPGPARPARVLNDGRSPAPRAVGDLLIALNKAGATHISAPVCAECGKHLRTLQRRGDDWYCGVCGPVREPCGSADASARSARATATGDHAAWRVRPTTDVTRRARGRRDSRRRRSAVDQTSPPQR